jgi:CBS domain-containing protein
VDKKIREIMTEKPTSLAATVTAADAARAMRDHDIGDVVVLENNRLCGIVTDRDIVVRALAEGRDPAVTTIGEICSRELTTLSPTDTVEKAARLMRDKAIRRLPVVDDGQVVGIVSLGDLAVERDRRSVLGEISAASPNL